MQRGSAPFMKQPATQGNVPKRMTPRKTGANNQLLYPTVGPAAYFPG